MVDTHDLFRRLGAGAKFDLRRFKEDAERFRIGPTKQTKPNDEIFDELDFFGTNKKDDKAMKANSSVVSEEKEIEKVITAEDKVEEKDVAETPVKKKKKKKRQSIEEGITENEVNGIDIHKKKKKKKEEEVEVMSSVDKEEENAIFKHIEQTNIFRKENRIHVHGFDIPDPFRTFDDIAKVTSKVLHRNIVENGYTEPTPIQMQAMSIMLEKRELLACAPTGSGKTLAFIIPILHQLKAPRKDGFRAVVLSPTRELASQIHREFNRMNANIGLKIHLLTKSKAASNDFGPKSSKQFDILIATPNRLVHMINQDNPTLILDKVEWLVLDEGDKLFEEGGAGFRDQIAEVYKACDNPLIKHALFSATMANNIEEWCQIHLADVVRVTVGTRNSAANDVEQELMFVGQESGKLLAMRQIIQKGFQPPVLVFVQSKDRAKELFNELIYDGLNVDVIHADRTQAQRDNTVKSFRIGKIWILIATELMGRGIDFKGVNLVVNYDFPPTAVSYIHRVGRTGRAGRKGRAITMFTEDDVVNLRSIANVMKSSGCEIPEWILQIKKPNRDIKKKLKKAPIQRSHIKTLSKYDHEKASKKKQMIKNAKAKKKKTENENEEN